MTRSWKQQAFHSLLPLLILLHQQSLLTLAHPRPLPQFVPDAGWDASPILPIDNDNTTTDPSSNPTPRKTLFDDLTTSGLGLIHVQYRAALPISIEGHIQSSHVTGTTDPSFFRKLQIETWDATVGKEISIMNSEVDARIWGKPFAWTPPGGGKAGVGVATFDWKDKRRCTLADAFEALVKQGKLAGPVEYVRLTSQRRKGGKGGRPYSNNSGVGLWQDYAVSNVTATDGIANESNTTAPADSQEAVGGNVLVQPYWVFHFEKQDLDTIWMGAWDKTIWSDKDFTSSSPDAASNGTTTTATVTGSENEAAISRVYNSTITTDSSLNMALGAVNRPGEVQTS